MIHILRRFLIDVKGLFRFILIRFNISSDSWKFILLQWLVDS